MAEQVAAGSPEPITSRRAWTVVALAGLLVVVGAVAVGLLVRPDPVREVAAGETLALAAPPPWDGDTLREVVLDHGVGVRLTTNDNLGDARDVVPPEGGTFLVVRVSDPRRGDAAPDVLAPPTTLTLVDGDRRFDLTPEARPTSAGAPLVVTTAVALDRSGDDAFDGLVLEAERSGAVTTVDLAPEVPEPSPPVPTGTPGNRSQPCAPADWPEGWSPEENEYDACAVATYPLVDVLGTLGPAPEGASWLPLVVDTEGTYLDAELDGRAYYLDGIPTSVDYRLGDLEPALVVPTTALQPPDRMPRAVPEDLVVFAVPADAEVDGLTLTFTATYGARAGGPDPRPTTAVALERSAALGE